MKYIWRNLQKLMFFVYFINSCMVIVNELKTHKSNNGAIPCIKFVRELCPLTDWFYKHNFDLASWSTEFV